MTYAIEAKDLEKTFGGTVRALDGVSFSVEQGTIFGLLGPNGAGKTTAVRILTTIISPDAGSASVLGHDVGEHPHIVRSLIGLAGQYAAVDENLTGRENLQMVSRLNHMSSASSVERAKTLLAQFDLTDAADRPLKTYSGGMRRRLDVAAALVARPKVLFLDEPTTGLDPQSRNDLWEVIEGLVGEGTTVLLTTQYLEEADRLANLIAVVDHGRVIAEGTPGELKSDLGTTVIDVGTSGPEQAAAVAELLSPVGPKKPTIVGTMVEVPVESGPAGAMEALRLLDQNGIVPSSFTLREPSLDDVFLSITGRTADVDGAEEQADGSRRGRRSRRRPAAAQGGNR